MKAWSRIKIIYRKELVDFLRDRRTLIAMIVIPVVLYPILMLWMVWTAEFEQARLREERFVVEVNDAQTQEELQGIIEAVQADEADETIFHFDVRVGQTPGTDLGQETHLRVELALSDSPAPLPPRLEVRIAYNEVDPLSRAALDQLVEVMNRFGEMMTRESVADLLGRRFVNQPATGPAGDERVDIVLRPVQITSTSTATQRQRGGWALGQIIPFILVLMTITGAIHPAVDLTAGERERGTLETLMVTPVPVVQLIVGKFLVVATIALLTALMNLASLAATMHLGGITQLLTTHMPVEFPFAALPVILLCLIPLALFFSAVLVAVCSFARTFKEAQHYIMPVVMVAMVASIPAAVPTARLEGPMLVLPVGNMVLLIRELLQETCGWLAGTVVFLSTSLYAAAAIALAVRLFGQEAVLFTDSGSFRSLFRRQLFRPVAKPVAAQALLLLAILFPVCFLFLGGLFGQSAEHFVSRFKWLVLFQFAGLFVVLPVALCAFLKIDLSNTFRTDSPPARAWLAALLLGLSTWLLAHEFFHIQAYVLPTSKGFMEFGQQLETQLGQASLITIIFFMAVVPAITEELLFRGFLLSGLSSSLRKWSAIVASAGVFALYHFMISRVPITFLLGILLAYVCWQSRSIWPGMLLHAMHNASAVTISRFPTAATRLGLAGGEDINGIPTPLIIGACVLLITALFILHSLPSEHRRRRFG